MEAEVTLQRHVRVVLDPGLDPLPVEHSSIGRQFRPEHLSLAWTRNGDEAWRLTRAEATGPVLRKGGGDTQVTGKRRLLSWDTLSTLADTAPEWARVAADAYGPAAWNPAASA